MSIVLWILQILLAVVFILAGAVKVARPYDELANRMPWAADYSHNAVRGIGAAEILGGIGLVLPGLLGFVPVLTVVSALGLALIMALAAWRHFRTGERGQLLFTGGLFILLIVVAWGRFSVAPF